jgi:Holliday junction resolvase-like predicted endonuclease
MINFQSESKKTGDEFELLVKDNLISRCLTIVDKNYCIPSIGIEVDYVAKCDDIVEYVEAKGGRSGGKKRPGAERTDNVKKAICNGALLKSYDPSACYVIYFSAPPKPNSYSDAMINTALNSGYVDEVRYL